MHRHKQIFDVPEAKKNTPFFLSQFSKFSEIIITFVPKYNTKHSMRCSLARRMECAYISGIFASRPKKNYIGM